MLQTKSGDFATFQGNFELNIETQCDRNKVLDHNMEERLETKLAVSAFEIHELCQEVVKLQDNQLGENTRQQTHFTLGQMVEKLAHLVEQQTTVFGTILPQISEQHLTKTILPHSFGKEELGQHTVKQIVSPKYKTVRVTISDTGASCNPRSTSSSGGTTTTVGLDVQTKYYQRLCFVTDDKDKQRSLLTCLRIHPNYHWESNKNGCVLIFGSDPQRCTEMERFLLHEGAELEGFLLHEVSPQTLSDLPPVVRSHRTISAKERQEFHHQRKVRQLQQFHNGQFQNNRESDRGTTVHQRHMSA